MYSAEEVRWLMTASWFYGLLSMLWVLWLLTRGVNRNG